MRSLAILVHGEVGVGKSWCGASSPAYRLVLDAEGGSRFAPETKTYWKPETGEAPPEPGKGRSTPAGEIEELDWRTCIVQVRDFRTMQQASEWLFAGQHPFRSVVVDSITEIQKRMIDSVSGVSQPTQQDWGEVLRVMEDLVRKMRDLLFHPTRPLDCVVFLALTHYKDGKFRPFVRGALELSMPGFVDVVGYLYVEADGDANLTRKMLIAPLGDLEAKDRTHGLTVAYGPIITNPNLESMLQVIDSSTT